MFLGFNPQFYRSSLIWFFQDYSSDGYVTSKNLFGKAEYDSQLANGFVSKVSKPYVDPQMLA